MPPCANCRHVRDVRLFEGILDGQTIRVWWCRECAYHEQGRGFELYLAPEWIERAALRQLPVKELPGRPARSHELASVRHDRRRGERRASTSRGNLPAVGPAEG